MGWRQKTEYNGMGRPMRVKERKRTFAFVAFEGAQLPNGKTLTYDVLCAFLDGLGMECALSPLHNRDRFNSNDIDKWVESHAKQNKKQGLSGLDADGLTPEQAERKPVVGQLKKPHWHVMCHTSNQRTYAGLCKLFAPLDIRFFWTDFDQNKYKRYECHLDSPDKEQYPVEEVRGFCGCDLSCLYGLSGTEERDYLKAIFKYINDKDIHDGYELMNAVIDEEDENLFTIVCEKTAQVRFYLDGKEKHDRRKAYEAEGIRFLDR